MSMTSPVAEPRIRKGPWLAGFLSIVFGLLTSCGREDKFELTLRVRDSDGRSPESECVLGGYSFYELNEPLNSPISKCVVGVARRDWVGDDGRRATSPAHTEITFLPQPVYDNIVCGGEQMVQRWWLKTHPELPAGETSFSLEIGDGNTVMLTRDIAVWVFGASRAGLDCFEGSGHWTGTAGELLDRSGSFTILDDSVQTVLRLVED